MSKENGANGDGMPAPASESLMLSLAGSSGSETERDKRLKAAVEQNEGRVERTLLSPNRPPIHIVIGDRARLEALRQEFPDLVIDRNSPLKLF